MKQILFFIENTSSPYLKSIIYLYISVFLCNIILCATGLIKDINSVMFILFYLGFPLLLIIHYKRYKVFIKNGGLTRIRLLPIKKSSFLLSELLFQLITYLGLFMINIVSWCVIYLLISSQLPFLHNSFIYFIMMNPMLYTYMPINFINIFFIIVLLISVTCVSTIFLISMETNKQGQTIMMYLFAFFILAIIQLHTSSWEIQNQSNLFLLIALIAIMPLNIHQLRSYFIWSTRR